MKAIAKDKDQPGFSVIEMDEPKCKPGGVIIKPRACGVCGSDMYFYDWIEFVQPMMRPHIPVVIGHEFGGEIVEVGAEVDALKTGDWVAVEPELSCGTCFFCRMGRPNICQRGATIGVDQDGAMAELVAVPAWNCYRVPKNIPFEDISNLEVLTTGIYALQRARSLAASTLAVIGVGAIGLLLIQAARACGAATIIAIDISNAEKRLLAAKKMGADEIIMADKEDLLKKMSMASEGGADIVVEATGTAPGFEEALQVGKKGCQIIMLGGGTAPVSFVPAQLLVLEKDILFAVKRTPKSWVTAVNLVSAGKISLQHIIDGRFSISDGLEAFKLLKAGKLTKAVIEP